jgi:chromosome segregation ATPase
MIIKRLANPAKPMPVQEIEQRVAAGEAKVFEAGKTLGSLREDIDSKKKEVQVVSGEISKLQETVAIVRNELEEVQVEKRKAEGELAIAKTNLVEVKKSTDKTIADAKSAVLMKNVSKFLLTLSQSKVRQGQPLLNLKFVRLTLRLVSQNLRTKLFHLKRKKRGCSLSLKEFRLQRRSLKR